MSMRRWFNRRVIRKRLWEEYRWNALARFNSEQMRGIVHTPEWCEQMAEEQKRFEQWEQRVLDAKANP